MTESEAQPEPVPMRGPGAALLWACFLGCSWTWVIGMLFPVLLVRDFGVWGWVVFLVPNAVGAAAMGFIIAGAGHSRSVVHHHREAMLRFSEVTVALHVFAVGWAYHRLFGNWGLLATLAVVLVVLGLARQRGALLAGAAAIALVSIAMFNGWTGWEGLALSLPEAARLGPVDLALLAPALVVGFALCPYLDLTFHHARQSTTATTGRLAFVLGFIVVFTVMMVFSLWYADALAGVFEPGGVIVLGGPALVVLGVHLTLQAGFTIALHVHEVAHRRGHAGLHRLFMLAVAGAALAWWAVSEPLTVYYGLSIGEIVYRVFLLFYGLAFPAYVLVCMIPSRRPVAWGPRLAVCLGAIVAAAPMAYAGFVMGRSWWVLGAVGVLVAGRVVVDVALPRAKPALEDRAGSGGPR